MNCFHTHALCFLGLAFLPGCDQGQDSKPAKDPISGTWQQGSLDLGRVETAFHQDGTVEMHCLWSQMELKLGSDFRDDARYRGKWKHITGTIYAPIDHPKRFSGPFDPSLPKHQKFIEKHKLKPISGRAYQYEFESDGGGNDESQPKNLWLVDNILYFDERDYMTIASPKKTTAINPEDKFSALHFGTWNISIFNGLVSLRGDKSKMFFFETTNGISFQILEADRGYWSAQDKKLNRQPFYLVHDLVLYRIKSESDQETALIKMIQAAIPGLEGEDERDPKILIGLVDQLKNREPMFSPKNQ